MRRGLRAPVLGDARTAEELGRSFAPARVRTSSGDRVLADVGDEPAILVATPGAEPVADGGYAAVVLLDTWLLLGRADLRSAEEALRRWSNAAGLVRLGGRVLAVGDPAHPALQALVRWDHSGFAEREIGQRQEAHLPPASRLATITGDPGAVDDATTLLSAPPGAEVLGPVPVGDDEERVVVRVPRAQGAALSHALRELQQVRSGRKLDPVRIQVDPAELEHSLPRLDHVAVRPIRLFGDPILRKPAIEVVDFDLELRTLITDLTETMLAAPGAGLAAPQLGVGLRAFTWNVDGEVGHLVNPSLELSEEIQDGPEGCLSLPELTYDCRRALSVVAKGFNMYGDPVTIEGSELLARAIQHETDHLDGVLFIDRLDSAARKAAMREIRESEWFGLEQPMVKVSPHRTGGLGL